MNDHNDIKKATDLGCFMIFIFLAAIAFLIWLIHYVLKTFIL